MILDFEKSTGLHACHQNSGIGAGIFCIFLRTQQYYFPVILNRFDAPNSLKSRLWVLLPYIIFWFHFEDLESTSNDIMAYVCIIYDESTKAFTEPLTP